MKSLQTLCAIVPLVFVIGCGNPADTVPKADVKSTSVPSTDAAKAPTTSESSGRIYAFGPENSSVQWVGSKVTGRHDGGFKQFTGELHVQNGKLADTGNKVVIDTTSIWADNDRVTGHLKTPDFFDVAQFPTAIFETTSITPQGTNSTVAGNLTLHGITKQIAFPAVIQISDEAVDLTANFFINRLDFDIKYPGKANDLIRKEVVLRLKVKASKKTGSKV
jgi:polyisoprenoid-binding protein YceI